MMVPPNPIEPNCMSPPGPARQTWLSPKAQGVLAINIAAVIFGTAALYGKLDVSPFWIVAMRGGFGALALALLGGYRANLRSLSASSWMSLALSGFFLAVHWVAFFLSVQLAGVAVATLTFATFPLFTVLVEAAQQRRLPHLTEIAVGIVIIVAVALLVEPGSGQRNVEGAVAGLVSGFTYALFWRAGYRLGKVLSPASVSFYQNIVVFALLAPTLVFSVPAPTTAVEWLSLAALGVFNTAVMLLLYLYALRRISPSTASGFIALEPVYAIVFAALFFEEPVTPWIAVSIVLIIGASLTLLRLERQPPPPVA
jgi:drug/metabolite transporter (DMT)-like permease